MNDLKYKILEEKKILLESENRRLKLEDENKVLIRNQQKNTNQNFNNLILNNISAGIYLIETKTGNILYANPTFEKMFGYETGELVGKHVSIVNAETDKSAQEIAREIIQKLEQTGFWEGEVANIKKDGSVFYCEAGVSTFEHSQYGTIWVSTHNDITERKKTEDALKESEVCFKNMFERHDAIMLLLEPETGLIINANNAAIRFYGYSKSKLCSMTINDINTLSPKQVLNARNNALNENSNHFDFLHKLENGDIRTVEVHSTPIEYNQQRILFSIIHDISERKNTEQALKESEYLHKETQKISKMGGWSYDVESDQMTFTDAIYEIYGTKLLTAEEGIKFYHPDDKEKVWNSFTEALLKQKPYDLEVKFINAQGDNLFVRTIGKPIIKNGKVVKVNGNLVDITEQKTAELTLKESESNLNSLINNRNESIWSVDKNYNFNILNNLFKEKYLTTFNIEIKQGMNVLNNLPPDLVEFWKSKYDKAFSGERVIFQYSYKLVNELYFFEVFLNPITLNGKVTGVSGISIDITKRKKTEEELNQSNKELFTSKEKANKNAEMILNSQSLAHICSYSTNLNENDLEKSSWVCSPEFYKIFGIDETYPHTIAGWVGFIHPDHREELVAYHEYVVKNRIPFSHEYKIIRINDGVERWVRGTGELVYDEPPTPRARH